MNLPPRHDAWNPLNPNAHQFLPQPPPNVRKPRQTQNGSSFTPEKAEIESLKIELGYARTKVVDLQTKNQDHEHTISIYSQKIKLLEGSRLDALHNKYFSPTSTIRCSENLKKWKIVLAHPDSHGGGHFQPLEKNGIKIRGRFLFLFSYFQIFK